ncbi:MAG: hypothetical protein KBT63_08625 [Porticoccaceae bacterium]|nr:hypothetical protein [Porticoccaceae bacterium]
MDFIPTLQLADKVAIGALIVSIISIIYAYRSRNTAHKSHEIAREAHEENKNLTKLIKKNTVLKSLGEVTKNYTEAMAFVSDSIIILEQLKDKDGLQELKDKQNEFKKEILNLKEMHNSINDQSELNDAAYFEELSSSVNQLVQASELMKTAESSRYRHIFRDLQAATNKEYIP